MERDQYHHGDLRTAVLDAAERELAADPATSLSIRALATALGVSPTAPHAHFKTKLDLLAALATRGFDRLHDETVASAARAANANDKLERLAEAYICFSLQNAGLYKIMFTAGVTLEKHPDLFAASRRAYAVLQSVIQEVYVGVRTSARDELALAAWSMVHGLSTLCSENRIPSDIISDRSPEALARIAAATILDAEPPCD